MAPGVILTSTTESIDVQGSLFSGIKFWVSQRVPQRARFVNDVRANGGQIVPLEKQADIQIVDHARKEALPGTYSYRFIELSLRKGALENLEDHAVGPVKGTVRDVGSTVRPPKGTRQKYTQEDERILWDWVHTNPQKGGGTEGNEIYKQLETKHPQHTWQSWRDHWIKYMKGRARPVYPPNNAPPTPPAEPVTAKDQAKPPLLSDSHGSDEDGFDSFSEEEAQDLMKNGESILAVGPEQTADAWQRWSQYHKGGASHSSARWRAYWERKILPRFRRRKAKQARTSVNDGATAQAAFVSNTIEPQPQLPLVDGSADERHQLHDEESEINPLESRAQKPLDLRPGSRASTSTDDQHRHMPRTEIQIQSRVDPQAENLSGFRRDARPDLRREVRTESPPLTVKKEKQSRTPEMLHRERASQDYDSGSETTSPIGSSFLKRKRLSIDGELPSSSPLQAHQATPRRQKAKMVLPREIASTPQGSPIRRTQKYAPLFVGAENEVDKVTDGLQESDAEELGQQPSESLSEPDRTIIASSNDLRDSIPFIDFSIPPPEGGWGSESEEGDSDKGVGFTTIKKEPDPEMHSEYESAFEQMPSPSRPRHAYLTEDTQALLASKTQQPDLTIPDPEAGWETLNPPSPVLPPPRAPQGRDTSRSLTQEDQRHHQRHRYVSPAVSDSDSVSNAKLNAWIAARVSEGAPEEEAEDVLQRTCMDTDLALRVLRHLRDQRSRVRRKGTAASAADQEIRIPDDWTGVWTDRDDEDLRSTDARHVMRVDEKHGPDGVEARWNFLALMEGNEDA